MKSEYEFDIRKALEGIKKVGGRFIGLQFPEGLKEYATEIAEKIEEDSEVTAVIFTDSVYGACDTKDRDAELIGLDLIIHFGHTDLKWYE